MRRYRKWLFAAVLVGAAAAAWQLTRADEGRGRFFTDQTYHFQTLRALSDIPYAGADTGEVLETVKRIRAGDVDGWFNAWNDTGDRVARHARATYDRLSRGRALLRAHNYYRTAEFLLEPGDPRRPPTWEKNLAAFYEGLDTLGVRYERIAAPYGDNHLKALYFPGPAGAEDKPLIVGVGGFDSTMEELWFVIAAGALERAIPCSSMKGPARVRRCANGS